MLPLDPELLIFLKFFIVLTCIFFWIKLAYDLIMRHHQLSRHRHDR